jgi:hypothetical protein
MPRKGDEILDIEVRLVRETEKAYLLICVETKETKWFPKSMISLEEETVGTVRYDDNLNVITKYTATMPTWLAKKNDFI